MTQQQHPIGTGFTPARSFDRNRIHPGPLLAGIGGVYLKDNDISPLDEDPKPFTFGTDADVVSTVVPHAIDPVSAERLWDLSEQLLKA
jgi:hypothetical protein